MRILTSRTTILFVFLLSLLGTKIKAQENTTITKQDPKFEQLLNEKRKINASISINELFKIQIFSGDSENAKKILTDCRQEFQDLDGTIVFNTPNYKVWIGNFKTRIDAERNLIEIKKNYPNALLIKPQK